jgi:biopolymer transport protein ExbD
MKLDLPSDEKAALPMSPLIDAVFLMLAFFLIATTYKKSDKQIDVDLPTSQSSVKLPLSDSVVVIGVNSEGNVFFEGRPILKTALHTDQAAQVHSVVELLEACQFRGLKNIGIRTFNGLASANQP